MDFSALDHSLILSDMMSVLKNNKIRGISEIVNLSFNGQWIKKISEWSPLRTVGIWFWRIVYMSAAIAIICIVIKVCLMTNGCSCCKQNGRTEQIIQRAEMELWTISTQPQRKRRSRYTKQYGFVDTEIV